MTDQTTPGPATAAHPASPVAHTGTGATVPTTAISGISAATAPTADATGTTVPGTAVPTATTAPGTAVPTATTAPGTAVPTATGTALPAGTAATSGVTGTAASDAAVPTAGIAGPGTTATPGAPGTSTGRPIGTTLPASTAPTAAAPTAGIAGPGTTATPGAPGSPGTAAPSTDLPTTAAPAPTVASAPTPASRRRVNFTLASAALFMFFVTWSLFSIWLTQDIGLSAGRSSLVISANAVGCLLTMPLYGYVQDKLGLRKNLLYWIGGLMLLVGPMYIYVYGPLLKTHFALGLVVGSVYLAMAFAVAVATLESYTERLGRFHGFEFGRARMFGSLGWAAATFFAGRLFNIDPELNFWAASVSAAVFVALIAAIRVTDGRRSAAVDAAASSVSLADVRSLLRYPAFWGLLLFVVAVTATYNTYDQMFPSYFSSLFGTKAEGNQMYSDLNSFQVFLEAGGMALAPFLVNRLGPKRSLLLSGFVMATRIGLSGLVTDPLAISAVKLMHAAELPIMLIAIFKYINRHFESRLSSSIYLVGFQLAAQLGAAIISPLAGIGYDSLGFAPTYLLMAATVAVFTAVSVATLRPDAKGLPESVPDVPASGRGAVPEPASL
ncbi:oligosaccharide MFS transporter [Streptomyces sp. NPDC048425]|uniref:oligosaccharide MFS transporter n=1 Tax=Streptomyces sp. NPDC048425 TaxID=3365548 RepID=UPI00371E1C6E